ncbi:type 1 glutamine amidotransferase [Rhodococcus opacus]|uniref:type 1 glutamine amidotransferase n=1 Tax=Rhodococcus opacus TaxID=37919 RepID=UPI001C438789|nr:type 1 glutamine amidotransferase [Rhodococcus opacus]MBV6755474.1 type 1 glutamine amidotransferase [Rhodococcus opacus]
MPGSRPRLLVIQPDPLVRLERFENWLIEGGLDIRTVSPFDGTALPATLHEDGLLVLGGSMSSLDDHAYPWLADIRRLFRHAIETQRPTFGICLGAQLLAQACGGEVTVGDHGIEAGVVDVRLLPDAGDDPVFADVGSPFCSGAMHGDMIRTMPASATWLGTSDPYPHQAFRVGQCAWGVQFHPELTPALYQEWVSADIGDEPAVREAKRRGGLDIDTRDGEIRTASFIMATNFARLVVARASSGAVTRHHTLSVEP